MVIPKEVKTILEKLHKAGFEAYIVGGCVRDFLLGNEPKDWDVATNAKPEEIQKIFPDSFYENNFLTVGVKTDMGVVEVTTYRSEAKYSDKRHPDAVEYAKTLEEDLSRRDFTVNAMAMEIQNAKIKNQNDNSKFKIIDPHKGQEDLKAKIIRTVGNPEERFNEDGLRLMRAARFATELNFEIEFNTRRA